MTQWPSRNLAATLFLMTVVAGQFGQVRGAEPQRFTAVPLDELGTGQYRGQEGGLYVQGRNEPPADHLAAANRALALIRPLDTQGRPATEGRIVLLGLGMSNTSQEFSAFQRLAAEGRKVPPHVILVNGAQGGRDAKAWAEEDRNRPDPWQEARRRLEQAGVAPTQVQCVWIKQALARPAQYGAFPAHAVALEKYLAEIIRRAKTEYPNLRLAYMSSRTYGGYASTPLNPEPYAYESAFAVRDLIQRQIAGDATLNHNPARGKVTAPVILWGPYLWADSGRPRKAGGLSWAPADVMPDGTHPSPQGRHKIGQVLLDFFADDPRGPRMFVAPAESKRAPRAGKPEPRDPKAKPGR